MRNVELQTENKARLGEPEDTTNEKPSLLLLHGTEFLRSVESSSPASNLVAPGKNWELSLSPDKSEYGRVAQMRMADFLAKQIGSIYLSELFSPIEHLEVTVVLKVSKDAVRVDASFDFDLGSWNHPWPPMLYASSLRQALLDQDFLPDWTFMSAVSWPFKEYSQEKNLDLYEVSFIFGTPLVNAQLGEIVRSFHAAYKAAHLRILAVMQAAMRKDALVASFNFPQEVAVPCEQYLMYFVQFLRDLGVGASATLEHSAGSVLFSVKPDDKDVALEKIHEALAVYLQLASSQVDGGMLDIASQQLVANIQHLRGQLVLANATFLAQAAIIQAKDAVIQAHDATIRSQKTTIAQQEMIMSGQILSGSLRYLTVGQDNMPLKETSDKAEFFGGTVELTKYEGKGISVNLARIYQHLRKLFEKN